jgi:hypothetical protein
LSIEDIRARRAGFDGIKAFLVGSVVESEHKHDDLKVPGDDPVRPPVYTISVSSAILTKVPPE